MENPCENNRTKFVEDINKLCKKCPYAIEINEGIENQIVYELRVKREILTQEQFKKFTDVEIESASKAIQKQLLWKRQHKNIDSENIYFPGVFRTYLWNIERIKAINKFVGENPYSEDEVKKTDPPFYPKVGALFAQGFIKQEGFDYVYKQTKFESCRKLSEYIKNNILETKNSINQYINDTLHSSGEKNIYESKTMLKATLKYCKKNNIKMTQQFIEKLHNHNIDTKL